MAETDMRRTGAENRKSILGETQDMDEPNYPWGMRITMEEPEVQKAGLGDLKVGDDLRVDASMKVVAVREEDPAGRTVELQITSLGKKDDTGAEPARVDTLYPIRTA